MDSKFRNQIIELEGDSFPSKSYTSLVLKPAYNEAKKNFLKSMLQIHTAHLVMLQEQGLVTEEEAKKIGYAIKNVEVDKLQKGEYDPKFEDLFFQVEHDLIKQAGDIAGNLHIGRSRNDMGIAIYRMTLREKLLDLLDGALHLRKSLIELSKEHIETIMIGYTHTQQAQPTTLGHYLNALTDMLTRDIGRLQSAYQTVNRSSMGAAALTTSGFPISRSRMQELLGFEDIIDNAWDAVSGADYIMETASVVQIAALNLGRSTQDFLLWGTQEFAAFQLAAPYVQISSIMPQKRNPVSIEHMRALLSGVAGDAQTVLTMVHNTPFGDIVDTEDDMQPYLWKAMDRLKGIYQLLSSVLLTMNVDKELLLNRAKESFANVTELADTIVREDGLSFRQAHHIVSGAVTSLTQSGKDSLSNLTLSLVNMYAQKVIGKPLTLTEDTFKNTLNPVSFVHVRTLPGGPAPSRMTTTLKKKNDEQQELLDWIKRKKDALEQYEQELKLHVHQWAKESE
ncbi:argininosuccinate lyase [Bacillus sp. V2I10]|uniref:argininosuccinate lyase n=1 Tax=Bacillus sp. V2I10 TaxID=3042276 RepID=UPI002782E3C5|nr:argininosuccinate lyase [Bacillus sp. V2I10]MDQ0862319.1 argininosuccinate lyase [Bacillus sp. V2I10]